MAVNLKTTSFRSPDFQFVSVCRCISVFGVPWNSHFVAGRRVIMRARLRRDTASGTSPPQPTMLHFIFPLGPWYNLIGLKVGTKSERLELPTIMSPINRVHYMKLWPIYYALTNRRPISKKVRVVHGL